jgi:Tol biopolymer transport system component
MKRIALGPVVTFISPALVVVVTLTMPLSTVVAQEATATATALLTGTVTAEALNVRSGPGADFEAVGVVHKDDVVGISGRNDDASWLYMVIDSLTGWVSASHVAVAGDIAVLPVTTSRVSVTPQPPESGEQPATAPTPSSPTPGAKGRIVFVSDTNGQNDIYSMNLDGSDWKRLTTTGGYHPRFSPDGQFIAYDSPMSGNSDIYVMESDGTGTRQLTTDPGPDVYPDWSPDGSQIVFVSNRGDWGNLYAMNTDGSAQRTLIDTPGVSESEPVWSPDGDKILFTQGVDGNGDGKITGVWVDQTYVSVLYLETMSVNRITEASEYYHTCRAVWHPNSYAFLFGSLERGQYWRIQQMNTDGTENRKVIASANSDLPDVYSSDGTKFLFDSWRHGHWEVFVANADGSNQVLLTNNQDNNRGADWVE